MAPRSWSFLSRATSTLARVTCSNSRGKLSSSSTDTPASRAHSRASPSRPSLAHTRAFKADCGLRSGIGPRPCKSRSRSSRRSSAASGGALGLLDARLMRDASGDHPAGAPEAGSTQLLRLFAGCSPATSRSPCSRASPPSPTYMSAVPSGRGSACSFAVRTPSLDGSAPQGGPGQPDVGREGCTPLE